MSKRAPTGAQAVLRAIALLKSFTTERPEKELSELARDTGLSRSTTHRLVGALESEGLVVRVSRSGRYRLGPSTVALGARALRSSKIRELAHPLLEALARESGETATLEVLSDGKMLILDEVLGAHLIGASPSLGTSWAIHATSTGKALLSTLPREKMLELLSAPLARFTARTTTALHVLETELARAREQGFAVAYEELEANYAAVGAVVHVPMEEPYATLSIGGPVARLTKDKARRLGDLVKSKADELSRSLGYE
ncbi:MAG TPA: IclR family transcriptional regulator [Vicinamibacteria bacterium]|nr:IclR family transcriptional regulator [Vicinamibacteria bacterium]